jgi:hypothetical protein
MSKFFDKYVFQIQQLLKTSRPGVSLPKVVLYKFDKRELCVFHTLNEYIDRTQNLRKSNKSFVSFKTLKAVTSCTLAKWLKQVFFLSGIDISKFSARSFRGASTSKPLGAGVSLKDILETANWASAKTFYKFYFEDVVHVENNFADKILNC